MRETVLNAENQQKILGYFIEEAKEHLQTLERGLLNLSTLTKDPEEVDELFRAAHSIKGGGAMLGYSSIQKVAHRLEDAFKILKDKEVKVDQQLESLFLSVLDTLQALLEQLEGPFGLQEEEAKKIVQAADPKFAQLQQYLEQATSAPAEPLAEPAVSQAPKGSVAAQIIPILREMLQWFKQADTPQTRQALQNLCDRLETITPQPNWQTLVKTAKQAIGNTKHSYRTIAPVVIKELKRGSDRLELAKAEKIAPSSSLQKLATASVPQVLLPVEPTAAANTLVQIFNQQQLAQIMQLIGSKQ